jgi:cytoskeletal protein CcmA (bactofilin family)
VRKAGDTMTGALTIQNNLTVTGNVSLGSLTVNGRMSVSDGVIQRGGAPLTTTADLGLYSQLDSQWIRFVTKNAPFLFYSDGGAGTTPMFIIEPSGNVKATSFLGDGSTLTGVVRTAGDIMTGALTIQNNLTVTGKVGIATTAAPSEKLEVNGNIKATSFLGDGSNLTGVVKNLDLAVKKAGDIMTGALTIQNNLTVTGSVSFGSQVRQMLNLWSTGYGIGVQNLTQYFRSDANFAWYKGGSHNDEELNPGGGAVQMVIKDGNVGIGTTNPGTKLEINGDLKVTGTITGTIDATNIATGTLNVARIPNLSANKIIDVYDIYLRGSAFESTEGNITFLKIANFDFGLTTQRGLNTIILNPGGAYRRKANHDVYGDKTNWNNWADWVNSNAAAGDLVAVASYDALSKAPRGGSAATLLDAINGKQAFSAEYRVSYALFFIKGESKCIEVLQAYRGPNAHLKTGYAFSQLSFNFNNFNSEEAWIVPAFMNSWTNYDTTYNPAGYFKDSLGIVHLRGLVKNGTNNTTIFTLPVGYRPSNRELQAVQTNPNTIGRVDILADGQVTVVSGSNVWVSLDGITFRAGG